ncbi:MAG: DUF3524 domain-containing protein [Rubricoccaceae bacterium]|nr:DUF3524 domain-containing protein [Rubricoccaceae bacterium]
MNVLALEPWYGGSHKHFLKDLSRHSRHDFRKLTMAARFWKWRMHGSAVTLAEKTEEQIQRGFQPDVIFASDMVNLPAFLSLTRHHFATTPVVQYFHENQLTYPIREGKERDYTYAYINYLSALAADRVVFNSQFHHDEFFTALPSLLKRFPDYTHLRTLHSLRSRSSVIHLGLDLAGHDQHAPSAEAARTREGGSLIVLWNQRWEYDKNPEAFFKVMNRLDDAGVPFRLILAGEHFEEQPEGFERAFERYADRILHYGYAEDFAEYSRLLHRADIVVSTARHEFFGIAMLEAIYCGCHPLLPNRLTYPELIPENLHSPLLHAPVLYEDEEQLFNILKRLLSGEDQPLPRSVLKEVPAHLAWEKHVVLFDDLLEEGVR